MDTLTASEARANLYRLIRRDRQNHISLSSLLANAAALYSCPLKTGMRCRRLCISSRVPGMRESIKAGMAEPLSKSAKKLKW